jgi:hypothetical protein
VPTGGAEGRRLSRETEAYRSAIMAYARRLLEHGQPSQAEREAIVRELAAGEEQVNISRLEEIIAPKGLQSSADEVIE